MTWRAIAGFRLVSADPEKLAGFYCALGFEAGERVPISRDEMAVLGLTGRGWRLPLTLGPSRLDLDAFELPGEAYPQDTRASDVIFQHCALVTDDAAHWWHRAQAAGALPISRDGPVTLPKSSGGVTAIKLRDPEGHPLELLQFPEGSRSDWRGRGMLGIDHSAIAVSDVDESCRFYAARGLTTGDPSLNEGPEQAALDGLDDPKVDVVPMNPASMPPHLELLRYRQPKGRAHAPLSANDIAATRVVWPAGTDALVRDPDGHLHQLIR
ncbi:VOC family protein [Novosphingobium aquimarinum]|uniref:VOC family protein n=1 Tax=Novosphingobium aquimarinum TaxID=2682494 RepID=UPI0012EBA157|nr:VOC family protein [Novosphingobium aquimarinum]